MKRGIPLALATLLIGACGSDEGGDAEEPAPPPAARKTAVFRSGEVKFTFEYPRSFTAERRARRGVLGQVSPSPRSQLNAIKIRRTADEELGTERYLDEFQRDFARTVGDVEKREERIAGREFGVLEFEDTLERDGRAAPFTSSSYFFAGAGRTWQLECIAGAKHRDEIAEACRTALESIRFERGD